MAPPRDGDRISPSGHVVLRGRRGVIVRTPAKGTCTWCTREITEPRRTRWCSQWCVDAFKATQPETQRALVEARDHGRCGSCGMCTHRMDRALHRLYRLHQRRADGWHACSQRVADVLTLRGLTTSVRQIQHWLSDRVVPWDMDHVVPIWEGGHPWDLRNLRTLCPWCHARETADGSRRRAERRHGVQDPGAQISLFGDGRPC